MDCEKCQRYFEKIREKDRVYQSERKEMRHLVGELILLIPPLSRRIDITKLISPGFARFDSSRLFWHKVKASRGFDLFLVLIVTGYIFILLEV